MCSIKYSKKKRRKAQIRSFSLIAQNFVCCYGLVGIWQVTSNRTTDTHTSPSEKGLRCIEGPNYVLWYRKQLILTIFNDTWIINLLILVEPTIQQKCLHRYEIQHIFNSIQTTQHNHPRKLRSQMSNSNIHYAKMYLMYFN